MAINLFGRGGGYKLMMSTVGTHKVELWPNWELEKNLYKLLEF